MKNKQSPQFKTDHGYAKSNQTTQDSESQLDRWVEQFEPVLRYINLHRFLCGFTLVCAFIAWNRGLMLLYVLVAFLIAVLIVSYIYWYINLKNIQVSKESQSITTVNNPLPISYTIDITSKHNKHKYFLDIHDTFERLNSDDLLTSEDKTFSQPLFFTHIHKQAAVSIEKTFKHRGVYLSQTIRMSSSYPLGLLTAQKKQRLPTHKIYVLPEIFAINNLDSATSQTTDSGLITSLQQGMDDEVSGLREYRRGDQFKHIHWGATARQISRGQPWLSKQFDSHSRPSLLIIINQFQLHKHAFETMLTVTSSFAHYASAQGYTCVIAGLDVFLQKDKNSQHTKHQPHNLQPWYLDIPLNSKHLAHNLTKLAKLSSLSTSIVSAHGIQNYTDLVAQSMSQHSSANTVISFSTFEQPLQVKNKTHIAIKIPKTTQKNSKIKQANTFHYTLCANIDIRELEVLFNNTSNKNEQQTSYSMQKERNTDSDQALNSFELNTLEHSNLERSDMEHRDKGAEA